MSNIAAIAIDRRAIPMVRVRLAVGAYDAGGNWIEGAPVEANIRAVIQPTTGRQLMDMPEGIRTEAKWMVWSRAEVLENDQIIHKGKSYRVLFSWPRDEGVFHRAAIGLLAHTVAP